MTFLRNNLKLIIFLLVFGLVGGYFATAYSLESLDPAMVDEAVAEAGSIELIFVVAIIQAVIYSVGLGIVGKLLTERIGLWRPFTLEKKPLIEVGLISLVGGILFIVPDYFIFANYSEVIRDSYLSKPTFNYIVACVTYAPVVEEVMLRLFFMSLIAFALWKLSRREKVTEIQLVIGNVISALLFAAGHLPATVMMIGITPMIIFRCFFMNGVFGLVFGYLFRKRGIHYAMLAHAGIHIVSIIIWFIFI